MKQNLRQKKTTILIEKKLYIHTHTHTHKRKIKSKELRNQIIGCSSYWITVQFHTKCQKEQFSYYFFD